MPRKRGRIQLVLPGQYAVSPGSFLPLDQREALERGEGPLHGRVSGCALVADLVGSTRMVEALVQALGLPRAAETLGGLLNRVFTGLIDRIHRHGGTVIHFGGDALTAWFDDPRQESALCCAFEIQEFLADQPPVLPGISRIQVRARTSLCSGEVLRCVVGDPRIQRMDVLVGSLMVRLARLNSRTPPERVCVDGGFLPLLHERGARFEAIPGSGEEGFAVSDLPVRASAGPEAAPVREVSLQEQWVHPAVEARLRSLGGRLLDEMRSVSTLFLHFQGIDYDRDPEAERRLDVLVRFVQGVFDRYEGVLLQVVPGDKGDYLYGCFGAPVAHEDDLDRGLLAALDLLHPPVEAGLDGPPSIGVSRGVSYAGAYGSPTRRTYGVLGREVIRAARLMELARSGEVLAPAEMVQKAPEFQVEPRGEVPLKGFEGATALVRVTGRAARVEAVLSRTADPLEGREEELRRLLDLLEALRGAGQGGLALLEGHPGIGKTRLAMEVAEQARLRGIRVLWGTGEALGSDSPYHAWRPLFEDLVHRETLPGEEPRATLERLVGRAGFRPEWACLLDVLFPFPWPEAPDVATMAPEVRANNTRALLAGVLGVSLAQRPALLVLEDLHWFDQASLRLLLEARARIPGALWLAVSRPLSGEEPGFPEVVAAATSRVSLVPLREDEVVAIACRRLQAERLHPDLRRWMVRNTEGNPLMVREMALNLRDRGLVEVRQGVASIVGGDPSVLPREAPSLREVFISRADRLEPDAQALLKVASVAGGSFPEGLLAHVMQAEGFPGSGQVQKALDRLEEAELLERGAERASGGSEGAWAFRHFLVREVIYGTLLEAQRRRIHGAMARWWEAQEEVRRPAPEVLAWHWQEAGDRERALDYLDLAAERALQRFANDVASSLFARALALLGEDSRDRERRARLELGLGIARVNLLRFAEATDNLARGLSLLGCPVPRSPGMQTFVLLQEAALHVLLRLGGSGSAPRSDAERDRMRMIVRALERLSELYYIRAQPTAAYLAGFRMINWAMRAGPSPEAARAHASFGAGVGFIPLHRAAPYYFQRARELLQQYQDPSTENYVLFMEGFYRLGTGAFEQTEPLLRWSLELSKQLRDERRQADALSQLVPLHMFRGEVAEARQCAEEMVSISRDRDYLRNLAEALYLRGWTALMSGEADQAFQDNEDLFELLRASPKTEDPFLALGVRAMRAYLELLRGENEIALFWIREAVARAKGYQPNFASGLPAFCLSGDLLFRLWKRGIRDISSRDLRDAVRLARTFARVFPVGRSGALRVEGQAAWIRGREKCARSRLRAAVEAARGIGMVLEEVHALLSLSEILPEDDPERQETLERCRVLLQHRKGLGGFRQRLRYLGVAGETFDDR